MADEDLHVRAVDRSHRIVQALQDLSGGTVTEVANRVDLPKSTVYNHLQTLHANDYVTRDGEEYRLGLRFLEVGTRGIAWTCSR